MNRTPALLASLVAASILPACAAPSSSTGPVEHSSSGQAADSSAITWRASSLAALDQTTGPAAAISVATPAGTTTGDVEIAAIASYGSTVVTAPSGWTLVKTQVDSTTTVGGHSGVATTVFSHVAGAGEPATVSFGFSASSRGVATIQSYENVDATTPVDAVASSAETTTRTGHTTPALTTSAAGDVLVGVFATVSPVEPGTMTSTIAHARVDRSCGNTGSWGIDLALFDSSPRTSAGAEAGRQAVSSSATDGATMMLLALRQKSAQKTLIGAAFNPHSDAYFTTLDNAWGGMQVIRSYDNGQGVQPFLATYQPFDVAHGAASNYSFKYQPSEVLAGTHDTAIRSFFQGIQDDHLVYWTYWHEPDDEIYKDHTFTASDYRAAWKHIRGIADGVKATRPNLQIQATLIIMEYSMTPPIAPSRPLEGSNGMYPGDDVIDVFGVDAYNGSANKGGLADAATEFGKVIAFAQAHNKPWGIGEMGSCPVKGNPGGVATWMDNALTYMAESGDPPVFIEWFNVDWSSCDYRIEGNASASAIWRQAMTQGISSFN